MRRGMELAQGFGHAVEASSSLELAAPVSLSLVCFRCKPRSAAAAAGSPEDDALQTRLLEAVKAQGVFIIHSKVLATPCHLAPHTLQLRPLSRDDST